MDLLSIVSLWGGFSETLATIGGVGDFTDLDDYKFVNLDDNKFWGVADDDDVVIMLYNPTATNMSSIYSATNMSSIYSATNMSSIYSATNMSSI